MCPSVVTDEQGECERSENGMLVKLAKRCLISKRTLLTVYCAKTGSISNFVFCSPRDFEYYLGKINNKTVNLVFAFISFNNAFNDKKRQFNIIPYGRKVSLVKLLG